MDVLPAQASAVPCERVSPSSKETCTLRRRRIRPELMEALQIPKYSIRTKRLAFGEHLIAKECDYALEGELTDHAVMELFDAGKFTELNDFLANRTYVTE